MGTSSVVNHIKAAKTEHSCSWCGEKIRIGEPYERWRWFDSGDVTTCKLHPECYEDHTQLGLTYGEWEFTLYDNPRGSASAQTQEH